MKDHESFVADLNEQLKESKGQLQEAQDCKSAAEDIAAKLKVRVCSRSACCVRHQCRDHAVSFVQKKLSFPQVEVENLSQKVSALENTLQTQDQAEQDLKDQNDKVASLSEKVIHFSRKLDLSCCFTSDQRELI